MTVKVLSTHAVEEVLRELVPGFEARNGMSLTIDYDPANVLRRRIEDGISFDVAIVTRPVIDALAGLGKMIRDTCVDIGRSGLGVAVREGMAKPDITTPDAFKGTLLSARSIVRSKDGTSGLYFETLLTRLGIVEAMHGKIIMGESGRIAELVACGEAEMAIQQIPELLPIRGTDFVGPLPAELQLYTVFSAGVGVAAGDRAAARHFIDNLTSAGSSALFIAKGLEPVLH